MRLSPVHLRKLLRRRRRLLAVLCAVLTVGVLAHHAMPEQAMGAGHGMPDQHAMSLMVICVGVAAAIGVWTVARTQRWRPIGRLLAPPQRCPSALTVASVVLPRARAGPLGPVVLLI